MQICIFNSLGDGRKLRFFYAWPLPYWSTFLQLLTIHGLAKSPESTWRVKQKPPGHSPNSWWFWPGQIFLYAWNIVAAIVICFRFTVPLDFILLRLGRRSCVGVLMLGKDIGMVGCSFWLRFRRLLNHQNQGIPQWSCCCWRSNPLSCLIAGQNFVVCGLF